MRSFLLILLLGCIATACNRSDSEALVYRNVYSVNLNGLHKKTASLNALIAFESQYEKTSFKLKDIDVDISIDGIDIGTYFSREPLTLKAKSQIKIPLAYSFENSKIVDEAGSNSSYIVVLKGTAKFTDEQGNEQKVNFTHKETVNTIAKNKVSKKNKKKNLDEDELSKTDIRKLRKEKKRDLKIEKNQ